MQPPKVDKGEKWKQNASFLSYSSLAFQMMASIALPTWAGLQLDRYLQNTFPWAVLLGCLLGLGASFYMVFKKLL
jgi:F0F1-type ATP synthase assembly protein I